MTSIANQPPSTLAVLTIASELNRLTTEYERCNRMIAGLETRQAQYQRPDPMRETLQSRIHDQLAEKASLVSQMDVLKNDLLWMQRQRKASEAA